jgi:hypothetical protein
MPTLTVSYINVRLPKALVFTVWVKVNSNHLRTE